MFQIWPKPPIVDWFHKTPRDLDRAFAWQRVAGVNPMNLARCARVPANLAVDEALYQRVMPGDSLARATAEGRLYIADYAAFDGLEAGSTDGIQKYISAPIALFAVDLSTGELLPVAIQCGQAPSKANPVVCPGERWRWGIGSAHPSTASSWNTFPTRSSSGSANGGRPSSPRKPN